MLSAACPHREAGARECVKIRATAALFRMSRACAREEPISSLPFHFLFFSFFSFFFLHSFSCPRCCEQPTPNCKGQCQENDLYCNGVYLVFFAFFLAFFYFIYLFHLFLLLFFF